MKYHEKDVNIVLIAVGSIPNSKLGQSIGIKTGIKTALKINQKMETWIPDVYAAGDCVETWHKILQKYTYSEYDQTKDFFHLSFPFAC